MKVYAAYSVFILAIALILLTGYERAYSHPTFETSINFLELRVNGGLDGEQQMYRYSDLDHTLTFIDFQNNNNSISKTLTESEIHNLANLVLASNITKSELYDPSPQQYLLSYIFTYAPEGSAIERFSGVGIWNDNTQNRNKLNFEGIQESIQNLIASTNHATNATRGP